MTTEPAAIPEHVGRPTRTTCGGGLCHTLFVRSIGMTMVAEPAQSMESDAAWAVGEREAIACMGAINLATARLVRTIRMLLETNGWVGHGISSPEQWVMWKADVSRSRAEGLVLHRPAHR